MSFHRISPSQVCASCGPFDQEQKWAAPTLAGPETSVLPCLGLNLGLEMNLVKQAELDLMKNTYFSLLLCRRQPWPPLTSMRTPNAISLILVFRFLEGSKEIWKEESPCLATIDLFWFRLADFYIKTKNKVILQGWPKLITLELVLPRRTGEGLISIWTASLRPRMMQTHQ